MVGRKEPFIAERARRVSCEIGEHDGIRAAARRKSQTADEGFPGTGVDFYLCAGGPGILTRFWTSAVPAPSQVLSCDGPLPERRPFFSNLPGNLSGNSPGFVLAFAVAMALGY